MGIPNLKTKLSKSLKKEIENERSNSGGGDKRILNYFDLDFDQKMKILFVPTPSGEFWTKFKTHGPNLVAGPKKRRVSGVQDIACAYTSSGEECPACQKGFELLNLARETGDESYKEEGKKWLGKDMVLTQCIVLESPVEINAAEDGNQVKLFYLPFAIEKLISEAIVEEMIDEDELCKTPFYIKKTKNQSGRASYESSYFGRSLISEDDLEVFEDLKVEPFEFTELDRVPKATSTEDVQEWLEKAEKAYARVSGKASSASESDEEDDSEEEEEVRPTRSITRRQKSKEEDDEDVEKESKSSDVDEDDEDDEEEEVETPKKSRNDRLAALRRRRA